MNKFIFFFCLVFCSLFSAYQSKAQVKYWVKLSDKKGTPYSVNTPSAFLSPQAISRRAFYNISIDQTDLPVSPSYSAQIENVPDVTVVYASKWLNGLVISIPSKSLAAAALATIRNFSFVSDTFRVKRMKLDIAKPQIPEPSSIQNFQRPSSNTSSTFNYGGSYWQNSQLDVICLHEKGFRGQGITIAVLDAGFQNTNTSSVFDSLRSNNGIIGTRDFVNGTSDAYYGSQHGTMVLSCMAANKPGRILGSAPMAKYWLLRTEDESSETVTEEYNWIRGAEFADSAGADILTTSLGYTDFNLTFQNHTYESLNGKTAPMSIAATMAARKGLFVLNAAGNEGQNTWKYISVAADADSICAVGAIDSLENVGGFSGRGPTFDGRIKPDLVARGVGAWVSEGLGDGFPGNGTSFATPILAGAVACYWQEHKSFSNHKVLDTLKKLATNTCLPNNNGGWGLPKLCYTSGIPSSTLNGQVFLEGTNNHDGIKVKFFYDNPSTKTDSVYTLSNGSYAINLSTHAGKWMFSKNGYQSKFYKDSTSINFGRCYTSSSVTLSQNTTLVPDLAFDFTVFVSSSLSRLQLDLSKTSYDFIKVEIYDQIGRTMTKVELPNNQYTSFFDVSFYPENIYIIKVTTSKGTMTKKFLK